MPKIKTHSGAKKRFKISKNGKPVPNAPTHTKRTAERYFSGKRRVRVFK